MSNKEKIIEYLQKDLNKNINIINFIENYKIDLLKQYGQSVLVKGRSDRNWIYISSDSKEELELIKKDLTKKDRNFAVLEDWMIPILIDEQQIKWEMSSMKLIFPNDIVVEEINQVDTLTCEDIDYIYKNSAYKAILSHHYIEERIKNGISACVREDNKLVAWAMTQDDGAIGFLNVIKEYRHKGYAKLVSKILINKIRQMNKIPFVHIEEDNIKSLTLAKKLGFVEDRRVSWIGIKQK